MTKIETMTALTRPLLSRQVIASAALQLTDEDGLAGLSMRKLGAELGVEAMSLYHYVSSKDDLLDAMVDQLCGEIETPPDDFGADAGSDLDQWRAQVHFTLRSFHMVLLRHRAAVELFSNRPVTGENGFIVLYWAHRKFAQIGLTPGESAEMLSLVVSYAMGRVASESGMMSRMRDDNMAIESMTDDPDVIEFFRCNHLLDSSKVFDIGLDCLLDGLFAHYGVPRAD